MTAIRNPQSTIRNARAKICGLRDWAALAAAAEGGAALVGFVFAPSRRQVTPDAAAALIHCLRATYGAGAPLAVGLFVNETPARMVAFADACALDLVQLCGDEAPDAELLAALGRPVIRVLRPAAGSAPAVLAEAAAWQAAAQAADGAQGPVVGLWGSRLLVGLDTPHGGQYGGTGQTGDWALAAEVARHIPLMLAGGLTPANVAAACAMVRPWLADVSSGVEADGVKSPALIRAFLINVALAQDYATN
jgi:phosphoribosylanthranilate isomerase